MIERTARILIAEDDQAMIFEHFLRVPLNPAKAKRQNKLISKLLASSFANRPYVHAREPDFSTAEFVTTQVERFYAQQGIAAKFGSGRRLEALLISRRTIAGEKSEFGRTLIEPIEVRRGILGPEKVLAAGLLFLALEHSEDPAVEADITELEARKAHGVSVRVDEDAVEDIKWLTELGLKEHGFRGTNSHGEVDRYGALVMSAMNPSEVRANIISAYPILNSLGQNI